MIDVRKAFRVVASAALFMIPPTCILYQEDPRHPDVKRFLYKSEFQQQRKERLEEAARENNVCSLLHKHHDGNYFEVPRGRSLAFNTLLSLLDLDVENKLACYMPLVDDVDAIRIFNERGYPVCDQNVFNPFQCITLDTMCELESSGSFNNPIDPAGSASLLEKLRLVSDLVKDGECYDNILNSTDPIWEVCKDDPPRGECNELITFSFILHHG